MRCYGYALAMSAMTVLFPLLSGCGGEFDSTPATERSVDADYGDSYAETEANDEAYEGSKYASAEAPSPPMRPREDMSAAPGMTSAEPSLVAPPAPGLTPLPSALPESVSGEDYEAPAENAFHYANRRPLSTFSVDVDTASYANVRRFLERGQLPPPDAVRVEELVNYFEYAYEPPYNGEPFAVHVDVAPCPWAPSHKLAKIGIRGRVLHRGQRPAANLVFLLDVSGSMGAANKLPLLKTAMGMLVEKLEPTDHVAIVTYAGRAGVALPSTQCSERRKILDTLNRLQAGGSTAGGAGIEEAYEVANKHYKPEGVNRVILCTDGDFNVGMTNNARLTQLIEEKARGGVFLTALGFGMGNYKDARLETLADHGNGNYGYIDNEREARKMLVEQAASTLVTIAKDVKIQVDFNPAHVAAYRLIGYENRKLRDEDFHDDTKDAGEIGAGHTVTALYELVPPGESIAATPRVTESKYVKTTAPEETTTVAATEDDDFPNELFRVLIRYKAPEGVTSALIEMPVLADDVYDRQPGEDFQFASAVAAYGMLLKQSPYKGDANWALVEELATAGLGRDHNGYRGQFLELVSTAKRLDRTVSMRD